jgi:hypothetical protein
MPLYAQAYPIYFGPNFFLLGPIAQAHGTTDEGGSELVSFPATQPPRSSHEQPRTLAPRRLAAGHWQGPRGDPRPATGKAQGATAGRARARGATTAGRARGSSGEAATSLHRPPFYSHEGEQQLHSSFTQLSTPVLLGFAI